MTMTNAGLWTFSDNPHGAIARENKKFLQDKFAENGCFVGIKYFAAPVRFNYMCYIWNQWAGIGLFYADESSIDLFSGMLESKYPNTIMREKVNYYQFCKILHTRPEYKERYPEWYAKYLEWKLDQVYHTNDYLYLKD